MRPSSPARVSAMPLMLVLGVLTPGLARSQGTPPAADPIGQIVEGLIAADADAAKPAAFVPFVQKMVSAIEDRTEAAALDATLGILRGASDWSDLERPQIEQLIDLVRAHRDAARIVRVAPAVLSLRHVAPDSPRVQYAVYELFMVPSRIRSVGRAIAALQRFGETLPREGDDAEVALSRFLAFIGCATDVSEGFRDLSMLRKQMEFYQALLTAGGQPRVLTAADIRVLQLREDLLVARRCGDQAKSVDLLQQLARCQEGNPTYPLMLGWTFASLGPKWSASKAREQLEHFLALTDPAQRAAVELDAARCRVEVQATLGSLGVRYVSLGKLRIEAKELLERLSSRRPPKELIDPDQEWLRRAVLSHQRRRDAKQKLCARCEARVSKAQAKVDEARRKMEDARHRPRRRGEVINTEFAHWCEVLQDRAHQLKRHKDKLHDLETARHALDARLQDLRAHYDRFEVKKRGPRR